MMKLTVLSLLALAVCEPAWAIMPFASTPAEVALCKARIVGRDTSDTKNWMHMHHYCDGLRFYSRALANMSNRADFDYYIQQSVGGFDYVLKHTAPDFYMRPDVTAEKARTLVLAGRKSEAVMLYSTVVNESPNFVPAYLFLADHYAGNNRNKALELVIQGLRHNPSTQSLQRRYRELGGKLPYPEPLVNTGPAVAAEGGKETAPGASTAAEVPVEAKSGTEAAPISAATDSTSNEPVPTSKIGSPKNPYCRFCVD